MSVEAWITLWSLVLWASMSALGLLAIYILLGFIRGLRNET